MKPCVYILLIEDANYYIGSTTDIKRRLIEHRQGAKAGTRYSKSVKEVFRQEFDTYAEANRMEKRLKKYKSKKIIEKIINDRVIKKNKHENLGP